MKIGSYTVDTNNLDKVFFPDLNITKGGIIEYYDRISDHLLPYLQNRPVTLSRYPDGINKNGFYQKEIPDYFSDWIDTIEVKKKEDGSIKQIVCNNKASLIYLVNQGTLSFHPWLSNTTNLYKPDRLVFDLDPPANDFELVLRGAKMLRTVLESDFELKTFVMLTGSEGMHIVSPLKPVIDFEEIRSFAKNVAQNLADKHPDMFTTEVRKKKRNKRLFLDYLRNSYAQTSVVPYSLRAKKGAPVATPLSWDELTKKGLHARSYHLKNIFKRLSQKGDAWENFFRYAADPKKLISKSDSQTSRSF